MKIGEKIKKYGEIGKKLRNSQQEQETWRARGQKMEGNRVPGFG